MKKTMNLSFFGTAILIFSTGAFANLQAEEFEQPTFQRKLSRIYIQNKGANAILFCISKNPAYSKATVLETGWFSCVGLNGALCSLSDDPWTFVTDTVPVGQDIAPLMIQQKLQMSVEVITKVRCE